MHAQRIHPIHNDPNISHQKYADLCNICCWLYIFPPEFLSSSMTEHFHNLGWRGAHQSEGESQIQAKESTTSQIYHA